MRLASPISAVSPRESERNASCSSASATSTPVRRGGLQLGAVAQTQRAQHALQPAGERGLVVAVGLAQPRRQFAPEPQRAVAGALAVALGERVEQPADGVGPDAPAPRRPPRRAPPSAPRTPPGSGRRAPRRSPPCRAGTGTASRPETPAAAATRVVVSAPGPRRRAAPPQRRASAPAAPASAPGAGRGAAAGRRAAGGSQRPEHLGGGALAGAHGAVHVAVPVASRSPCPPSGCCPTGARICVAVGQQRARAGDRRPGSRASTARSSSASRRSRVGLRASAPKNVRELAEHRVAALGRGRACVKLARLSPPTKPKITPGLPSSRRVVEGRADEPVGETAGAVEALVAPERLVVDGGDLGQRALAVALGELVALERQRRARSRSARPASAAMATITRLAVTVARSDSTVHAACAWTIRRTGELQDARACRGRAAIRSAIRCVPPAKRHICAPSRVLKLRSNVPGCCSLPDGGDVEEHEQQRQLARLGAEDRARRERHELAEARADALLALIQVSSVWPSHSRGAWRPSTARRPAPRSAIVVELLTTVRQVGAGSSGPAARCPVGPVSLYVERWPSAVVDVLARRRRCRTSRRRAPWPARGCGPGSGRRTCRRARRSRRRRARGSARARRRGRAPRARAPTCRPWTSSRAAVSPAKPAPTTTTSALRVAAALALRLALASASAAPGERPARRRRRRRPCRGIAGG